MRSSIRQSLRASVLAALQAAPSGSPTPAAVSYVGGQTSGRAGAATTLDVAFSLAGGSDAAPAAGDLVLIACACGTQGVGSPGPAQAISGYTPLGQIFADGTTEVSFNVSYKRMTSTPDTQFTVPSTGATGRGQAWTVQVFRGVDPGADLTALFNTSSSTTAPMPNPPSITPTVEGSWVVVCGATAIATGAVFTPPANFVDDFLTHRQNDSTDACIGSGYWPGWTSGPVDPAAYTNWGGTAASAAFTIVLPPG